MADYSKRAPGVYVEQAPSGTAPIAGVSTSTAGFVGVVPDTQAVPTGGTLAKVGQVVLVTNFTEFKNSFGDFAPAGTTADPGQTTLAQAVFGFFNNGGSRCYVTRVTPATGASGGAPDYQNVDITAAVALFEPIDEIAIVAAPGLTTAAAYSVLTTHCTLLGTRFAILDTPQTVETASGQLDLTKLAKGGALMPAKSDYAAVYFPWIAVRDPTSATPGATALVPPSGHIAGVYARVDTQRGVHKAPANETVLGALGLKYSVSRAQQDGLNPQGVNCIRNLQGNITIWGARTVGGEDNADFKYVNVRRLFNYLRGSIDNGTQWAVFEPNNQDLWARITRNVSAFLQVVYETGALFGAKPEDAFYVKCDSETNPAALRDLGEVVTEIGVAIVRPAEFVVFKLGQKAAS
jgi:phage tail sheath protein FI